jgi:predicted O-methyltransferase YrrM
VKVDIERIKELIPQAMAEPDTGDAWLERRYLEDIPIIAHTNPYYKLFYMISQEFQPKFTVELGAYRGTGGAHFAAGNPKGYVYTIDIHREDKVAQAKAREAAGHYGNLEYINGWTWDPAVVFQVGSYAADVPIDILFIDAWHEYQYAMHEWEIYSTMLSSEALVICDDIFDVQGATVDMVQFWEDVSAGYESFLNKKGHIGVPMGFIRYER